MEYPFVKKHLTEQQMYALLEGEQNSVAQEHLAECPKCSQSLQQKKSLRQALHELKTPKLTPQASSAMSDRFMSQLPSQAKRSSSWLWPAFAAGGLMTASAAVVLWIFAASPATTDKPEKNERFSTVRELPSENKELDKLLFQPQLQPQPILQHEEEPKLAAAPKKTAKKRHHRIPAQVIRAPKKQVEKVAVAVPYGPPELKQEELVVEQIEETATEAAQPEPLDIEKSADVYLALLEKAQTSDEMKQSLFGYKSLMAVNSRRMAPLRVVARAERIASLALPTPYDEEAAYIACESALAAKSYESAYRLCSNYIERFPRGPHTREVAYFAATVARLHLDDCRAAVTRYSQALVFSGMLQSYNDEAYFGRALCYASLGETDLARSDLDMYLHKRPHRLKSKQVQDLIQKLGY